MKNADEAIERVLAGLRGVEASAGFEERLERRMERRVREAVRERGRAGWFGVWQGVWQGVAVGCVAMVLVGVGVSLRLREKRDFVATTIGSSGDTRLQAGVERGDEVEEGVSQRLKPRVGLRGGWHG